MRPALAVALVALAACQTLEVRTADMRPHLARRAGYVRDIAPLLASAEARAELTSRLARSGITEVVPYGMGPLLASSEGRAALAAWIEEAHRGGARVIAPVAGRDRLEALLAFAAEHPAARFDAMVTELEYWNANDGDVPAALDGLLELLAAMRGRAAVPVGAYLGYPTAAEAARIAAAVDFVFLDYPVGDPARAWAHVHPRGGALRERFGWFARAGVEVWPIFYAAGEVDMGAALRDAGLAAAEARYRADLAADPELGADDVAGFVYFTIEALP